MAKSKQYKDVIKLGKLLVKELDLENTVDTLGRWMAHHISELITNSKTYKGLQKQAAEDRCREAILALWRHIDVFKKSHKPLGETEALIATIRALDPDNIAYFYYQEQTNMLERIKHSKDTKKWLEISSNIDISARILISICLKNAAKDIENNNQEWLELSNSLDVDIPQTQLVRYLLIDSKSSDEDVVKENITKEIEELEQRHDRLELFIKQIEIFKKEITHNIQSLEKDLHQ